MSRPPVSSLRARTLRWPVLVPVLLVAVVVSLVPFVADMDRSQVTAPEPLPLGTFTEGGTGGGRCPDGHTCTDFTVSNCTNVAKAQDGVIAYAPAIGTPRGMVVFFSGGGGTYFWSPNNVAAEQLVADVRAEGLAVVQVRWTRAWEAATEGETDAGAAHVACRPATAVKWIHDNLYTDLNVPSHGVGECGFCVTGTSGGASQTAYPLSHYGLENILDAIVPVSGPTHAAMAKGCLRRPAEEDYWYAGASTRNIDNTFGFLGQEGPCRSNAEPPYDKVFWERRWNEESVATQGSEYTHPQTRVHMVIGEKDAPMQAHSLDYYNRLIGAGSPLVVREVVTGMHHSVTESPAGMAAMKAALVGTGSPPPPPPPPTPQLSVNDQSIAEGDTLTKTVTFTVSLSAASDKTVTVDYATADGTATVADNDYAAKTGTLSFAPNETTKTVPVVVNGDTRVEPDETFNVTLTSPTNATLADGQGVGTIVDDDDTDPPVSVVTNGGFENGLTGWTSTSASAVSSPTRTGTGAARLGGTLSSFSGILQSVTVPADGQLEAWVRVEGNDTSAADTLQVQIGVGRTLTTVATVTSAAAHGTYLRLTADLSAYEGQTVNVRFLASNDATNPTTFYVDDVSLVAGSTEPPPTVPALSVDDVRVTEGNAGSTTATFTVSLSAASTSPVTVDWATAGGTATAGQDYVTGNGALTFAAGDRTRTITVVVNGDSDVEPDETFLVNLSGATNATIGDGQGVGTIGNDDSSPPPPPPSGSVVTNGDFSDGLNGWTTYATWVETPARSVPGAARTGGSDRAVGGLVQTVTVPTGGQFEAWVWVEGTEMSGADKLELQVGSGRSYQTITASTITSAAAHGTWLQMTADLSAYAGQTTNLRFLYTIDATNPTTFYIDDVSLVAG